MDFIGSFLNRDSSSSCSSQQSSSGITESLNFLLGNQYFLVVAGFVMVVGLITLVNIVISLLKVALENHVLTTRNGKNLLKYGAGQGKYALITGSTDGIGKEFAFELAKCGFNLVLVSRTLKKLESVRKELLDQFSGREIKVYQLDFSRASNADYDQLKRFLASLPISVLVNNVGMNHALPIPFAEESVEVLDNIINVNIGTTVKVTHMILPYMMSQKNGLIVNVGSFAGMAPIPYLQTYSGSKAFLRFWSEALAAEVKGSGVHVEYLNTYFVATNMSKIKRASLIVPSAKVYVKNVVRRLGRSTNITPYPIHNLMTWFLQTFVPQSLLIDRSLVMQQDIRKRALRKQAKEQKSQ